MGVSASHTALPVDVRSPTAEIAEVLLERLRDQFYRDISPGFRTRLIVIFVLISSYILMATAYLAYLYLESRHEFWCFRLVKRPTGIYIVPNYKVLCTISSMTMGVLSLFYTRDLYRVYLLDDSQDHSNGWRGYIFVPLFVHGWLSSCAICIALRLTTEHDGSHHIPRWMRNFVSSGSLKKCLSGRATNISFIGGGLLLLAMGCAAAAPFMVAGDKLWHMYLSSRDILTPLVGTGQNIDPALNARLLEDHQAILKQWNRYFDLAIVAFSVIGVLPAVIATINFSSLILGRIMQRRIDSKMTMDIDLEAISASNERSIADQRQDRFETKEELDQSSNVSDSLHRHAVAQVDSLKKAKNDLIMVAAAVFCVTVVMTLLCIGIAVAAGSGRLLEGNWWLWEAVFTIPMWSYAVVCNVIFVCLFWNAWVHRRRDIAATFSTDRGTEDRRPSVVSEHRTSLAFTEMLAEGPSVARQWGRGKAICS